MKSQTSTYTLFRGVPYSGLDLEYIANRKEGSLEYAHDDSVKRLGC